MNWAYFEMQLQPWLSPPWLEGLRVDRARRTSRLSAEPRRTRARRLFVDVSVISRHDAGTGIQRVVRAVASELLGAGNADWEIVPVAATHKNPYHPVAWPQGPLGDASPCALGPGDVFLGLDFALDTVRLHRRQLAGFKRQGAQLWFLMYDLLPAQRPDWFSAKVVVRYRRWLRILAGLADGFFCISPTVEADLRTELARRFQLTDGFSTTILPMGGNLQASRPSSGLPPGFEDLLVKLAQQPTALMVGTIEPRKGHADIVQAFDLLWQQGCQFNLLIVGRPGWNTMALQEWLRTHPRRGKNLFWLEDASDEALDRLYKASEGVILASYAEGFGLPLAEALEYGKPVLARDLPVFRLHAQHGLTYFPADAAPNDLASMISHWLGRGARPAVHPDSQRATWATTASRILGRFSA